MPFRKHLHHRTRFFFMSFTTLSDPDMQGLHVSVNNPGTSFLWLFFLSLSLCGGLGPQVRVVSCGPGWTFPCWRTGPSRAWGGGARPSSRRCKPKWVQTPLSTQTQTHTLQPLLMQTQRNEHKSWILYSWTYRDPVSVHSFDLTREIVISDDITAVRTRRPIFWLSAGLAIR